MGTNKKYAGFWIRCVAHFIDGLVLLLPLFIVGVIVGIVSFGSTVSDSAGMVYDWLIIVISTLITLTYYAGMESSRFKGTLGKMAVGIQVETESGDAITILNAVGRYFAKFLSGILYIGYIMVAFTEKKKGLHDFIAKTEVVYKR